MKTTSSVVQALALIALGAAIGAGSRYQIAPATRSAQRSTPAQPKATAIIGPAQPSRSKTTPVALTPLRQHVILSAAKNLLPPTERNQILRSPSLPQNDSAFKDIVYTGDQPLQHFESAPVKANAPIKPASISVVSGALEATSTYTLPPVEQTSVRGQAKPFNIDVAEITPRAVPTPQPTPMATVVMESTPTVHPTPVVVEEAVTFPEITSRLEPILESRPRVDGVLTLERAVEIALRESPVIRGAAAEVEAAEGRLNAARAERKPWVSANTFLSGGTLPNIIESPQTVQPSAIVGLPRGAFIDQNLMVMYPLFTSGRLKAMTRQAAALRSASEAELEAQRQEVALMTRVAYREVLARRAVVDIWVARLREDEEQLRIDRARADEGKIPSFYVLRDEAEAAQTRQEITNARRDVELSLLQLKTVMGIHLGSRVEIQERLAYEPSTSWLQQLGGTSNDVGALLRLAERQRPELRAAQHRVLAAQSETSAIKSSYRPQINAFGMGDVMRSREEGSTGGITFGLAASIPLYSGGQKNARLQTANAERKKQEAERQQTALQIGQEVGNAVVNLRAAEQNIGTAQTAMKSAQEDYRVARLRYESDKSVVVEVLDALAVRVRAESNSVQAMYAYNIARDQLLRAVGALDVSTPAERDAVKNVKGASSPQ